MNVCVQDNIMMTLMGSADAIPSAPTVLAKHLDEMTAKERAAVLKMPCGLKNLGNTCYLNATIQCLKSVPEFVDALDKYPVQLAEAMRANAGRLNPSQSMTAATRDLYRMMNQNEEVTPLILVQVSTACLLPSSIL